MRMGIDGRRGINRSEFLTKLSKMLNTPTIPGRQRRATEKRLISDLSRKGKKQTKNKATGLIMALPNPNAMYQKKPRMGTGRIIRTSEIRYEKKNVE